MCLLRTTTMTLCAAALLIATVDRAVPADSEPGSGAWVTVSSQGRTQGASSQDELADWHKPLDEIRLDAKPTAGPLPVDLSGGLFTPPGSAGEGTAVRHTQSVFQWKPTNLACQPTYFEEVPLERYGQTVSPLAQPLLSGIHFFGMFPITPYKMGIDRTHDPIYTLGYYRVGSDAPPVRQRLPFEWDAAAFEAATWLGLIFVLP